MLTVFLRQFKNPLLLVFIIATFVSFLLGQRFEAFVILFIMFISVLLGFWNEYRAEKVVKDLLKRITFYVDVERNGRTMKILASDVLVGDLVSLEAGSIVPADLVLIQSRGLSVNESILTGESFPVDKNNDDFVYMGTVIEGGFAKGVVKIIGQNTKFGKISKEISKIRPETSFQKGLREFSYLLARIAAIAVIFIVVINFYLGKPVVETALFALTIAMGITPELLPLIVTLTLSHGAKILAKKGVVVKEFNTIEDLGNMEVLCTDKTGTLTEGKITLQSYENLKGEKDDEVLKMALLCSIRKDTINQSIKAYAKINNFKLDTDHEIIEENPFDFEKRFSSVKIKKGNKVFTVKKGSPEVIFKTKEHLELVKSLELQGLRIIGVSVDDAPLGFLTFFDTPKKDLHEAFERFKALGVAIKIITGDNENVTKKICDDVGFKYNGVLTSNEIEKMSDIELSKKVMETDIFARVTPSQKMRIIQAFKSFKHSVGYIGDGINDGPSLRFADVGISVNTGVDVAKDSASVVLENKNLTSVAIGIKVGRITFENTIKYILMGASSDFGNMVSAGVGSLFLPFLPMMPVQVLINDMLYDFSQTGIPNDNVDVDEIRKPKSWNVDYIKKFMILFGLIGTAYDLITFAVMYFVFHARGSYFQTGWFVTSFVTQILVVFVIRTRKIPFWKSKPDPMFAFTCLATVVFALYLPFSPLASYFSFTTLPWKYFIFLIFLSITYLGLVEAGKYYLNHETSNSKS